MTIQTSDIEHADSNSSFYYTFVGTKGMTSEHLADNEGKDMQVGKVDTWTFTDSADIGEFMCVKIRIDGTDGWYFDKVLDSIYNSDSSRFQFKCTYCKAYYTDSRLIGSCPYIRVSFHTMSGKVLEVFYFCGIVFGCSNY